MMPKWNRSSPHLQRWHQLHVWPKFQWQSGHKRRRVEYSHPITLISLAQKSWCKSAYIVSDIDISSRSYQKFNASPCWRKVQRGIAILYKSIIIVSKRYSNKVILLTFPLALTSAPYLIKISATSKLLKSTAKCRGVIPPYSKKLHYPASFISQVGIKWLSCCGRDTYIRYLNSNCNYRISGIDLNSRSYQ